jgi:hypothetical protein
MTSVVCEACGRFPAVAGDILCERCRTAPADPIVVDARPKLAAVRELPDTVRPTTVEYPDDGHLLIVPAPTHPIAVAKEFLQRFCSPCRG